MSEIERISPLVKKATELADEIKKGEQHIKERKAALRKMLDVDIPELMTELGLFSVTTSEGKAVEIVPFIDARIAVANKPRAFGWLRENGFGDLIKHQVVAQFAAGEDAEASACKLYLEENHFTTIDKQEVHPQTLKAWARERDEKGEEIPEDIFGIYRGTTTKIK